MIGIYFIECLVSIFALKNESKKYYMLCYGDLFKIIVTLYEKYIFLHLSYLGHITDVSSFVYSQSPHFQNSQTSAVVMWYLTEFGLSVYTVEL